VDERLRQRIRLLAFCLLLAVLPLVTAPGRIIADTKLDLAINPAAFLARALSLWDPQQFGQLQDQAVGYLFPMGPFFYLGRLAALQPWVIQRLWISAVAVTAFLGTVRLAGRLGIGTSWTRVAAGCAYALSPAGLTLIGGLSAEFLPAAMLPWILIPLVDATRGGRRSAAAARSAAAVGLCGGVNAAATIAVLIPAVLYVLTVSQPAAGRVPRWRILGWWCPAVLAATWWWVIPLALLARYGVSVIPYTESAAVTTSVTGLSETLRGTENWVSYLVVDGQPWWQPGYRIVTGALPNLLTGVLAGLGLAGLLRPRLPGRRFLLCLLLTGVVIISAGHVSGLGGPLAGPVDHLINGPASAFRNLRKFDPLIRLPAVLGLAHLLAAVRLPRLRPLLTAAAALAIGGLALPAYTGGVAPAGAFSQIPGYWVNAANWLNRHARHQAVLVVPGAPFGQYAWGSPLDDVLQPLLTADWAERDLSAIGSPGNARLLDAIDQRIAAGDGSAGLTQVLARMGVRYVVVRDDLSRAVLSGAWPALVNQALATSPGLTRVFQSRPLVGTAAPNDAVTDLDPPYPAVVIYRVAGPAPVVSIQPAAGALRVFGAPESLLTLADEGLLAGRPVLLNADAAGLPAAASVVTDSLRRRVRNFGELRTSYSPTLTATEPARTFEAIGDYTEPGWNRYLSMAQYHGISGVTASSSAADIGTIPSQWASGLLPYAAIDGDMRTMWESGSWGGPIGQWIRFRFASPVDPRSIRVAFADQPLIGPAVTQVVVRTAAGQVTDRPRATGQPQRLHVPPGGTGWLQITITGLASPPARFGTQVAIREVTVPGVRASRAIVAPAGPARSRGGPAPAAVVLAKAQPWPSGCMRTWLRWVCSPSLIVPTEEQFGFDQALRASVAGPAALRGSAVLVSASRAGQYLGAGGVQVHASSSYTPNPQDQARAAFDGDPATVWTASTTDAQPILTIGWRHPRTVGKITIQRPPDAEGLLQVLIAGSGGQVRGANVGPSGVVRFAPMRTTRLTIRFTPLQVPLQISEVKIRGVPPLRTASAPLRLRCGLGPALEVNGKAVPTRAWGSDADLLAERPLHFAACAPVALRPGSNQVTEPAADAYSVQDVVVGHVPPAAAASVPRAARARILAWTASRRVLRVTAGPVSYLVVNENFNPGWRAVIGGRPLRAVRLDGWKQAWLLPSGSAGLVTLTYLPNAVYRVAILGGLSSLALVMVLAVRPWAWRRRRRSGSGPAPVPALAPAAGSASAPAPAASAGPATGCAATGRPATSPRRHRQSRARPHPAIARALAGLGLASGLALAGLWLGGYPGAAILPVATAGFLAACSRSRRTRRGPAGPGRPGSWITSPWLPAGLLLAATAAGVAGEHLVLSGNDGPVALWLVDGIPQAICLVVIGRLAAALIGPEPGPGGGQPAAQP
jgi:arabinofuranan 3-O-arabinosyltransferase